MSDRFKHLALARRASVAALILGKDQDFRLFYLHEDGVDEEIRAAAEQGYRSFGVIGMVNDRIMMEQEPDASLMLMLAARVEFMSAVAFMAASRCATVH
jgi:hypothetical protein